MTNRGEDRAIGSKDQDAPGVWLIAGPTASGKSHLALDLARRFDGEIINADSIQLYRDFEILTARPGPQDLASVPHHLYGTVDGRDAWSVGRWLRETTVRLDAIAARGRRAIIVGGTGLYFLALTRGLSDAPSAPLEVREQAKAQLADEGEARFRQSLAEVDPEAAARILPGDRQRLTRAWEVYLHTGKPLTAWWGEARPLLTDPPALVLDPPRDALYARCNARLHAMVAQGVLAEIEAWRARSLSPDAPVSKAVGLRELAEAVEGRVTLSDALALAAQATRRYAKRQATWFRHQAPSWPRLTCLDPDEQRVEATAILMRTG